MDSNVKPYNWVSSYDRIGTILNLPSGNYEEVDNLPDRDRLTYNNGFYAECSAVFIDLRDSSSLPKTYYRHAAARIYRAFISESVAVLNSHDRTREVNIVGDCVWGVYNTPTNDDMNEVFALGFKLNSLMRMLNYQMKQNEYNTPIKAGIGISYGRALMIKAGYNGSGISDVVYMGDVVNSAAKLAAMGNKSYAPAIFADYDFWKYLSEENQKLLRRQGYTDNYAGDVVSTAMEDWFQANCT